MSAPREIISHLNTKFENLRGWALRNWEIPLFRFRLIASVLFLDMVVILFYFQISPFFLLNVFSFLKDPVRDARKELVLYYPGSVELGIPLAIASIQSSDAKNPDKKQSEEEKRLMEEEMQGRIAAKIVEIKQPVLQVTTIERGDQPWRLSGILKDDTSGDPSVASSHLEKTAKDDAGDVLKENILQILHQLARDPDNLRGRKAFETADYIRGFWVLGDGTLVLQTRAELTVARSEEDRKVAKACLEKSILRNLPQIKSVAIVE